MYRFIVFIIMGLCFTTKASAIDISFSGINYANVTAPGGQDFTFSADGNNWEVNVQADTWGDTFSPQVITNTNLSFVAPFGFFINPIWPDAEGVFYRQIPLYDDFIVDSSFL